ncbi:MAG: hypothetical protein KTR19_12950, partial [Hyphomicrobiales bacterium]|nr:hypothetical protein [Hyphomicrobiales bacterium]
MRKRKRGLLSSTTRICVRFIVIMLVLLGVGFGALYARLSQSPISLSFMVPPIERAVNSSLDGMSFEIGDAVIQRSPTHVLGIEFRLAAVRLLGEDGAPIAESPFASGGFSVAALFSGRLAPSHLELIGPKLYVYFSDENGLALSFSEQRSGNKGNLSPALDTNENTFGRTDSTVQSVQGRPVVAGEQAGLVRQARGRAVNLTKALKQAFRRSRSGESAYLTTFGIK